MASEGQPWPHLDLGLPASGTENGAFLSGKLPSRELCYSLANSHSSIFSLFCMKHMLLVNKKFNMGER